MLLAFVVGLAAASSTMPKRSQIRPFLSRAWCHAGIVPAMSSGCLACRTRKCRLRHNRALLMSVRMPMRMCQRASLPHGGRKTASPMVCRLSRRRQTSLRKRGKREGKRFTTNRCCAASETAAVCPCLIGATPIRKQQSGCAVPQSGERLRLRRLSRAAGGCD